MKKIILYECDCCGKQFKIEHACVVHEMKCKEEQKKGIEYVYNKYTSQKVVQ